MAAFENWHLQRGCLKPADASVFDIGGNQPAYINRHMDPMLGPTGITDLAKEEMFGGGRRTVQRPGGSKEEVPPYGVGAYVPFVPPPPSQTREERHALPLCILGDLRRLLLPPRLTARVKHDPPRLGQRPHVLTEHILQRAHSALCVIRRGARGTRTVIARGAREDAPL